MRLVIVTHVVHYQKDQLLYAYAPYAREVDIWADLFDQIVIAAPLRGSEPPGDCVPLTRSNVHVVAQNELGGATFLAKLGSVCALPLAVRDLIRVMTQGDAIHVRCPSSLALVGILVAPFCSKHLIAKFAGQWDATPSDPWSVRLQRAILRSRWWHGPVTIYGNWPDQPAHIVPFFSSALTATELAQATVAAQKRTDEESRRILFVGRLSRAKNVDVLLSALRQLRTEDVPFQCTIVGEGPELSPLKDLRDKLGLGDCVTFTGGLSFDRVLGLYGHSGILVLASQTEGWPKAIAEAMAFGLIAIGSNLGQIPRMLAGGRGLIVPAGDADALANILHPILTSPEQYAAMRERAMAWGKSYSLDCLRDSLRLLLAQHWGVPTITNAGARSVVPAASLHP